MLVLLIATALGVKATDQFRAHRYDSFKPLPITSEDIVFVGNSITNMNEWSEWFGDTWNANIKHRGNSGGTAMEWNQQFETVLQGKPAKIFLMIGTNEIGSQTALEVSRRVRALIARCRAESPATQLYVQSILPSTNSRSLAKIEAANALINAACVELGATYVDLYDDLKDINNDEITDAAEKLSFDNLHLTAKGYYIWVNKIAPLIGLDPIITSSPEQDNLGISGSLGMRVTYFSVLPIKSEDIVIIGDEMIHGGEWKEYLGCKYIKNRGTGWGITQGLSIDNHLKQIPLILHGGATPRAIVLNIPVGDVNKYWQVVEKIQELSPTTEIFVSNLYTNDAAALKTKFDAETAVSDDDEDDAKALKGRLHWIDILSSIYDGTSYDEKYLAPDAEGGKKYVSGMGYAVIANKIGEALNEVFPGLTNPISMDEAEVRVNALTNKNLLGYAISSQLMDAPKVGDNPGDITQEGYDAYQALLNEAYALLEKNVITDDELSEEKAKLEAFSLDEYLAGGLTKTPPTEPGWYNIIATEGMPYEKGFPYVTNTSKLFKQNNTNYYALRLAEYDAANPAKHLVYITPNDTEDNQIQVQGSTGLYPASNGVTQTAPTYINVNNGRIGNWQFYEAVENADNVPTENPYLGGSSSTDARFGFVKADVSGYKIYKVAIIDVIHSESTVSELVNVLWTDPTGERNKGVPTAFNGGYYFVDPEKLLQPDEDLSKLFSAPAINGKMPVIYLDKDGGFNDPEPDPDDENYVAPVHSADEYDLIVVDYSDDNQVLDISELDNPGYYRVKMTMYKGNRDVDWINSGKNNVRSAEIDVIHQQNNGTYPTYYDATDAASPASEFFYLTRKENDDTDHSQNGYNLFDIRTLHGLYLNNLCVSYTAKTGAIKITRANNVTGKFHIGSVANERQWSDYVVNNVRYGGGGSNTENRFEFIKVLPEELDQYDIYAISIDPSITRSGTPANDLDRKKDVKVTLGYNDGDEITPLAGNMGLRSVYNNGRFFIAKGTEIIPTHFHVENAAEPGASQEFKVTIGEKNADGEIPVTITIGDVVTEDDLFDDPDNKAHELITQAGWYKIKLVAPVEADDADSQTTKNIAATCKTMVDEGRNWILNAENEFRQGATAFYPLKIAAADAELGATNHIYIKPSDVNNKFYINGLNGHILNDDVRSCVPGTVNRVTFYADTDDDGFNIGSYWAPYDPGNAAGADEKPYMGRYSSGNYSKLRYEIAHVTADELALYSIYKVTIVGGVENGTEIGSNTRVALDIPRNKGIRKVYDGGYFFVEKGDPLTSADFTPDAIEGKSVAVTIGEATTNEADGLDYIPVTVTYGDAIGAITVSGIEAAGVLAKALALNVPVTVSGSLTSAGTPAIEPALFGVKEDLSETGIALSDFTVDGLNWSVTLTPSMAIATPAALTFTYGRGETPMEATDKVSVTVLPNATRAVISLEGLEANIGSDGIPRYTIAAGDPDLKPVYALYDNDEATGDPIDNSSNYIDVDFYYNFIGDPVTIEPGQSIEVTQPGVMVISAIVLNPDGSKALVQDLRVSITQGEVTGIEVDGIRVDSEDPEAEPEYVNETTVSISETFTVSGKITPEFAYIDKSLLAVEGAGSSLSLSNTYQEGSVWSMTFTPLAATEADQPVVLTFKYNKEGVKAAEKTIKVNIRPNVSTGELSIAETEVAVGDVITPSVKFDVENPHVSAPEFSFEPEDAVTVTTDAEGTKTYTAAKAGDVTVKATATNLNGSFVSISDIVISIAYAEPTAVSIDTESLPEKGVVLGDSFTPLASTDNENPDYEIAFAFDPADAVEAVTDEDGNILGFTALKAGEVKVTATAKKDDGHILTSEPASVIFVEPEPAEIPEELEEMLEEITDGNKEEIAAIVDEIKEALEEGAEVDIEVEDLKGHIVMEIEIDAESETSVALPKAATGEAAKEFFYKSSDTGIATVDQEGVVTAIKGGRVFITMQIHLATAAAPAPETQAMLMDAEPEEAEAKEPEGKLLATHIYLVSVKENGRIESVEVPSGVTLTPGENTTIDVTVNGGDGMPEGQEINWSSEDGVTVTPSEDGSSLTVAAGDQDGEFIITGTYTDGYGKTKTIEIPVTIARKGSTIVGIDEINADIKAGRREVYDLQGRRVTGVARSGIYIVDGVKTFIR